MNKLPEKCWAVNPGGRPGEQIVIVKRGESGYYPQQVGIVYPDLLPKEQAQGIVNERNAELGVSRQQSEAMLTGSMFGWDCPAADPNNYNPDGTWRKWCLKLWKKSLMEFESRNWRRS